MNEFLDRRLPLRLPLENPPWEIHYFENYSESESAMVLLAHHSMGDGLSAQFSMMFTSDEDYTE